MIAWTDRRGHIFVTENLPDKMLLLAQGKEKRLLQAVRATAPMAKDGNGRVVPGMEEEQASAEAVGHVRKYRDRLQHAMRLGVRRRPA